MLCNLILLRGLPGSGKSTLAKVISEGNWPVFSIDDYFTDQISGNYIFDYKKNHLAYSACENACKKAMQEGVKKIIIDNTLTLDWEIENYFKLAKQFKYRVFVCTVEKYHQNDNIHQISDEQIKKMANKYKVKLF